VNMRGSVKIIRPVQPEPMPAVLYRRHKDDMEVWGHTRGCAPCPAVWPYSDHKVPVTMQLQFFIYAINEGMPAQYVDALFGPALAFCNRAVDDLRRSWLLLRDLTRPDPDLDRVRTCSRSAMSGTTKFSLVQAFKDSVSAIFKGSFKGLRKALSLTTDNVLVPVMFDGWSNPPLKPGRLYPTRVQDVKLDDYLLTPEYNREYFFGATITNAKGHTVPFPHGIIRPYTNDGRPYVWMPHISRRPVEVPLANLVTLPLGSPPPSAYYP